MAETLHERLKADGYHYQAAPHAAAKNTVFIASRQPFEAVTFPGQPADDELGDFTHRVLMARVGDLSVIGLYLPGLEKKRPVFDFLLDLPADYLEGDTILMGDLNTGRHNEDEKGATFTSAYQFDALLEQGWVDSWRSRNPEAREFTWYSRGHNNGFRLDHALVSPSVDQRIQAVRYFHREPEEGITDHSLMVVDVEVG